MRRPEASSLAAVAFEVFESVPEGIVVADRDFRNIYVNPVATALLHKPQHELVGLHYLEVFPGLAGTTFDEVFRRVMATRSPEVVDDYYPPLDRWFRGHVTPYSGGITMFFSDVTAEHQQRTRLLQDLELLQQVVDHAEVGIVLKDLDGRYLLVNRAAAEPMGVPPAEVIGHTAADFYPPKIADRLRRYELEVQRTCAARHREERVEYRPGEPLTFLSVTFPAYNSEGRLVATGAVHADVTKWKDTEAELAASEKRFHDVFRSTSLGLVLVTADGQVVEANEAVCAMLGYDREDFVGMHMADLSLGGTPWSDRLQRMLEMGRGGYEREDTVLRRDGSPVPVLGTVNLVKGGAAPLFSVILRDLTDVHALQERLVGAERMEAVGRLAAGISHDVNNVLAAVSGYTQLLSDALEQPELVRHVNGIHRSVERASDMVAQLLAFSRQQHLEPVDVDLPAVVTDLEDMLRRLLPAGTELTTDCQQVGAVRADVAQVQQVLLNLVLNARDALPDGGRIGIAIDTVDVNGHTGRTGDDAVLPAGRYARVAVTDDGVGMPPEVVSHCFEPFYTTHQHSGGHGLGLSTAFGIARQSGGDLQVSSQPGLGTRFDLLLPLVQVEQGAGAVPPKATVVLAEDDSEVRNVIKELLTSHGHRVLSAADGAAAVGLAVENDTAPDVLVTDINMPGLDGPAVAAALRQRWSDLPVLFLSGSHPDPASLPGRFLRKPFTGKELVAVVEALAAGRDR